MSYDAESDKVILVPRTGNNLRSLSSQTWIFDLNARTWQKRGGPPWSEGPMAYDAQSDRIILFLGTRGGVTNITGAGQTWAYDYNTDTWTNMEPAEGPFGLLGARMVYDSESDRIILFGGISAEGFGPIEDTWAYDYETNSWTNMQPTGSPPPGDNFFAMSYDVAADRVIAWRCPLRAGQTPNKIGVYDYNSNTWEEKETQTQPTYCWYNAMVYDPGTGLNILFGGQKPGADERPTKETWGYDYASNSWKRLPATNPPSARGWHAMVYHAKAGVIVLFGGGASRAEFTDETWVYDPVNGEWSNYSISP